MKRILLILLSVAFAGCSGAPALENKARVSFRVSESITKVPSDEVTCLDVFVFRTDGMLEGTSRSSGHSVECSVKTGLDYRWYLLANSTEVFAVSSESGLLTSVMHMENIVTETPLMLASGTLDAGTSEVQAVLARAICKVTVQDLRAKFLEDSYQNSQVRLESIYLYNAGVSIPVGMDGSLATRANHTGIDALWSNKTALEYRIPIRDEHIRPSHSLISFPCAGVGLVIHLTIDGRNNYYTVWLPEMKCNTEYVVKDLILLGPGAENPGEDVPRENIAFSINIKPWSAIDTPATFN